MFLFEVEMCLHSSLSPYKRTIQEFVYQCEVISDLVLVEVSLKIRLEDVDEMKQEMEDHSCTREDEIENKYNVSECIVAGITEEAAHLG